MVLVGSKVRRVYSNVIQVHIHELVQKIPQDVIDHGLKDSRCVSQAKWHYTVLVKSTGGVEPGFPLIPLSNADQMVSITKIEFSKDFSLLKLVRY